MENKWFYCDFLGWVPPTDLNSKVEFILNLFSQEFTLFRKPAHGRFLAHKLQGNSAVAHKCIDACFQNIPLQSCGSICGVIVVAMGAISCINSTLWLSWNQKFFSCRNFMDKESYIALLLLAKSPDPLDNCTRY